VAFDNPHAVTTHVQPIPSATLHLQLILQLGRPDPSIASETEVIAPISNMGLAGLFPGKLSRCQLVADVIGEAVVGMTAKGLALDRPLVLGHGQPAGVLSKRRFVGHGGGPIGLGLSESKPDAREPDARASPMGLGGRQV
jgi:hypothetical protein